MKRWARKSRLPLLVKELTEQAARRRTYLIRVVYAAGLFACFLLMLRSELFGYAGTNPESVLGSGRSLFRAIVFLQFGTVFAFLPAMMSGVLTYEKERDSLSLLFLTDLRPWEIILQKYLGRLIPMLTFLLLSMPLTALAYSMGGITLDDLIRSGYMVLLTCLQVGAFALMCSSYCRTSLSAFLCSYVGCGLFYLSPLLFISILSGFFDTSFRADQWLILLPPFILDRSPRSSLAEFILLDSLPITASTVLFLSFAKSQLFRRAFVQPRSALLQFFKRLDRFYEGLNFLTGGIVLIEDRNTLPADTPIFWRETSRKSLGKPVYLFRVLLLLEVPAIFLATIAGYDRHGLQSDSGISWMLFVLWTISALWIVAAAANVVAGDRTDQTLEVLLTTPISGGQIVRQKMGAMRRLIVVLSVPLLTLVFLEVFFEIRRNDGTLATYLASSLLAILIYPQMLAWVALWIGMKCATRMRAILVSLIVLVLWCVLPCVIAVIMGWDRPGNNWGFSIYLSPGVALISTELNDFPMISNKSDIWPLILLNYLWYAGILLYFRRRCLNGADRLLGRMSRGGGWWRFRHGAGRLTEPGEARKGAA
ncbi:MAG: hypothetical protein ABSA67_07920 [Candidatus Brocadiia bacterium]|jgi:ABC-type transport system involved in multi-copper enzyme maturation permease subunit